ncbi:MAG: right-handed parallel beta-helix repeat-containing protein [Candidatus Eisenbacteria sp.]|nr:right-handed parallel beta-helix repeat-containing protein [Candidatus Eisenbacteria bacterium]
MKTLFLTITTLLALWNLGEVQATTWYVHPDSTLNSIQTALYYCAPGDEVLVAAGTYNETLNWPNTHSIRLVSESGPELTIIDGGGIWSVISIAMPQDSTTVIEGFTIQNGVGHPHGGGIFLDYASPLIWNNIIQNNEAGFGGGVGCYPCHPASPIIRENVLQDNYGYTSGGGVGSCAGTIEGNLIHNNSSGTMGGGLEGCSGPIQHNVIQYNSSHWGGGLAACGGPIRYNIIQNNSAYWGGGLNNCSIEACIIRNNHADSSGGGLDRPGYIRNSLIENNTAASWGGGGMYCAGTVFLENSTIVGNYGEWWGGGIKCDEHTDLTIRHCVICGNLSPRAGGAIHVEESSKVFIDSSFVADNGTRDYVAAGMLHITDDADSVRISNSHLYYNTYQADAEIENHTSIVIPIEHNFWWDTTAAGIAGLIQGPNDHEPWETAFIPGVPGEPTDVDSIANYDSAFFCVVDSLGADPDTLYLRICGVDRSPSIREAAIAIVRSSIYPGGIAVALTETDIGTGIYQGKAVVRTHTGADDIRTDDSYQTIRVDPMGDTIVITANMDAGVTCTVRYRLPVAGVSNEKPTSVCHLRQNHPNPFNLSTQISYDLPVDCQVKLTIHDVLGRVVATLVDQSQKAGQHHEECGANIPSGFYSYRLVTSSGIMEEKRMIHLR